MKPIAPYLPTVSVLKALLDGWFPVECRICKRVFLQTAKNPDFLCRKCEKEMRDAQKSQNA